MSPNTSTALLSALTTMLKENGRACVVAVLSLTVVAATEPAFAWIVKAAVDNNAQAQGHLAGGVIAPLILGLFLLRGAASVGASVYVGTLSANFVTMMQSKYATSFFQRARGEAPAAAPGDIVHLAVFEVKQLADFVERVFTKLLRHALTTTFIAAYAFYLNWLVSLPLIPALLVVWLICRALRRPLRAATSEHIASSQQLANLICDSADRLRLIQLHASERQEFDRFARGAEALRRASVKIHVSAALAAPLTQTFCMLVFAAVAIALIFQVQHGHISKGDAIAYVTNLLLLLGPLKNLAELNGPLYRGIGGAAALLRMTDAVPPPLPLPERQAALSGEIRFDRVSFGYPGATRLALDSVSFSVQPGSKTAIVGPCGAGKSTILRLLSGECASSRGTICIDQVARERGDLLELRGELAFISQTVELSDRSLLENIVIGDATPDVDRANAAIALAGLLPLLAILPQRELTSVGRNGAGLSGGQRKQIALARALYRRASILLFDEAESAFDAELEQEIWDALLRHLPGHTMIMITHSAALLDKVDQVVFIDAGRVAGAGVHARLVEDCAAYATLLRLKKTS